MNLARVSRPAGELASGRASPDGAARPLPPEKYYMPGSILRVAVDNTSPLAHRLRAACRRVLRQQPGVQLGPDAAIKGIRPVAWFDSTTPLRSGWAWGQHYLNGGAERRASARLARDGCSCSGRRSPSAPSRTARSSSCSTASISAQPTPTTDRRARQTAGDRGSHCATRGTRVCGCRHSAHNPPAIIYVSALLAMNCRVLSGGTDLARSGRIARCCASHKGARDGPPADRVRRPLRRDSRGCR